MSYINQDHRRQIVRGMMKRTSFKLRFQQAIEVAGAALHAQQIQLSAEQYGSLLEYITTIPREHLGHLCCEHEGFFLSRQDYYLQSLGRERPRFVALVKESNCAAEDLFDFTHGHVTFRYPRSLWLPRDAHKVQVTSIATHPCMAALEKLTTDYEAVRDELTAFLASVRTVKQLEATMPEAMGFIQLRSNVPAVILNPANALAALARAGFEVEEEVAA